MFAVLAALLAVLAGFDVTAGEVSPFDFACFALAALALHFAVPLSLGRRS